MTYSESAKGITISRARAVQELRDHGISAQVDFDEFDLEMGIHATYRADKVLRWLGY
ncbi:hypothetical protein UFOVP16_11 [uncultured Caudovirales phage]|uniref:Uncharacterized protein n=1 Tax=uncultured Caudovirales phage TaxID=2100421 RepID=A0A6J5KK03_9CAUD|nr:hypothetical protein UFOVP16_11 [uncultured Caudovirales phage]